jgi:hypothetical protein
MRKLFIIQAALMLVVLFSACKKTSTSNDPACGNISSFTVVQQLDAFKFNITPVNNALYYEASVVNTVNSNTDPQAGAILVLDSSVVSKYLNDTYIFDAGNTFLVYVRSVCTAGKGNWSQPIRITITSYCDRPKNLQMSNSSTGQTLYWTTSNPTVSNNYQVQYGTRGFALGSGATTTVTNPAFEGIRMSAGAYYDFYVRTGCGAGWSSWVGPFTYLSNADQNNCVAPSNVQYTIQRNSSNQAIAANFTWAYNGESNFEYTFVYDYQAVGDGIIYTIGTSATPTVFVSRNINYHFYVRSVCANGNRTSWVGPKLFNIGF